MRDYANYFRAGPGTDAPGRIAHLGKLYLPSGRVYCCDPFLSDETAPFEQTVASGHYEVALRLLQMPQWGTRVALAALILAEQHPRRWVDATYRLGKQRGANFRVDAGLACFMDAQTAEMFRAVVDEFYHARPEDNYYTDVLASEFKRNSDPDDPRGDGDWDLHYPRPADPRNLAIFATGLGDGVYSAFWGIGDDETPVMLVADFNLLD